MGGGRLTFATATDTMNYKSVATVTFTTAGQVRKGGKIVIVMPPNSVTKTNSSQVEWRFEGNDLESPAVVVSFTTPRLQTPTVSGITTLGRQLSITIGDISLTQQTQYVFRISKVITPNQVSQALRDTKISTQDKLGNDIDTTSNCATDAIGIPKLGKSFVILS